MTFGAGGPPTLLTGLAATVSVPSPPSPTWPVSASRRAASRSATCCSATERILARQHPASMFFTASQPPSSTVGSIPIVTRVTGSAPARSPAAAPAPPRSAPADPGSPAPTSPDVLR